MKKATVLVKDFALKVKEANDADYTITGIFSTADEDRHGEEIDQTGWNIAEYMNNPVVLFGHDQWRPAVGRMIELTIADGALSGKIQFAVEEDKSGLAETLYNLYKNKFMRAFSVGFANDLFEYDEENDRAILRKNTLYEVSCVNVPANARALAYSKGIDLKSLEQFRKNKQKGFDLSVESMAELSQAIADKLKPIDQKQPTTKAQINKAIRQLWKQKSILINNHK